MSTVKQPFRLIYLNDVMKLLCDIMRTLIQRKRTVSVLVINHYMKADWKITEQSPILSNGSLHKKADCFLLLENV